MKARRRRKKKEWKSTWIYLYLPLPLTAWEMHSFSPKVNFNFTHFFKKIYGFQNQVIHSFCLRGCLFIFIFLWKNFSKTNFLLSRPLGLLFLTNFLLQCVTLKKNAFYFQRGREREGGERSLMENLEIKKVKIFVYF